MNAQTRGQDKKRQRPTTTIAEQTAKHTTTSPTLRPYVRVFCATDASKHAALPPIHPPPCPTVWAPGQPPAILNRPPVPPVPAPPAPHPSPVQPRRWPPHQARPATAHGGQARHAGGVGCHPHRRRRLPSLSLIQPPAGRGRRPRQPRIWPLLPPCTRPSRHYRAALRSWSAGAP